MSHYRWIVVGIAFWSVLISYFDRTALSYAIAPIEQTFHLTNKEFGGVLSAFGIGYFFMTFGGGIIVDRFGARKIWCFFAVLWSVVCFILGTATGFAWLFIGRLLLGLAEGPTFPALNRVATDWLPVSERARAVALSIAAVPFSSVIGAPFISNLIGLIGWRYTFCVLGLFGVIWAIVWVVIFRDRPEDSHHVSQSELKYIKNELEITPTLEAPVNDHKTTWRFLLFNKSLLTNNYAYFAFGYLLFFSINWLPGYLEQTYFIEVKKTGWILVIPWLTATILLLLGGFISDKLWQKTHSIRIARSHVIWICQILSVICFVPLVLSHSLWIDIISLSLGLGFGIMPNSVFYAINSDLAHDRAGTSLGIMICASAAAAILSPWLTGFLSARTGNFSVAFMLMMGLTLSSAFAIAFFQYPDEDLARKWIDAIPTKSKQV
jgi:MFS family permease